MGRWLVDAVGAPHHPQCRRWQVLVPSRRPTPLCTSTLFHGPFTHPGFPFHPASGVCSPSSSCIHRLPTSTSSSPSSFPLPHPQPLLSQRPSFSSKLASRHPSGSSTTSISDSLSRRFSQSPSQSIPSARFATSTISPRKPAAIRTSSAPTQPIPPNSRREKEGSSFALPDPCSGPPQPVRQLRLRSAIDICRQRVTVLVTASPQTRPIYRASA